MYIQTIHDKQIANTSFGNLYRKVEWFDYVIPPEIPPRNTAKIGVSASLAHCCS